MKLSFRAFQEWLDFPGTAQQLADTLSELGFPNDGITHRGEGLDQVIVGKILEKSKHPQADRLSLLKVNVGSETLPIVCGAQNMKVGDLVALAPVGAIVPGKDRSGLHIKESKIRGELSKGMCCSEAELCLSEESDGIILLPAALGEHLGKKLNTLVQWEDWVLEIDITPNRADALSIRGLAREVAAKLGLKLKTQATGKWKNPAGTANPSIENLQDASGFAACLISGLRWMKSPAHWERFLQSFGARSLGSLVDITNIVLFELGHPVHFFDAEKMDPLSIGVRRAKTGEKLELLNGQTIELHPEDLVIADKNGVLSLAGIMGGAASSVSVTTTSVLMEVACFNPALIRASARRHGLSSESSFRFERGLTSFRLDEPIERALGLLKEVGGFEIASGTKVVDKSLTTKQVLWDRKRIESKLGALQQSDDELFECLRRLEYGFEPKGATVRVVFPWYRTDVGFLEDAMEDIARLVGYENLQTKILSSEESAETVKPLHPFFQKVDELVSEFQNKGFAECVHMSFGDSAYEAKIFDSKRRAVPLLNPLHSEKSELRRFLLPQLLERARFNFNHGESDIRLVEAGPCFEWADSGSQYEDSPRVERWKIACVWLPRPGDEKKLWQNRFENFYDFKGRLMSTWSKFTNSVQPDEEIRRILHPKRQIAIAGSFFGELHPLIAKRADLPGVCYVGEWYLSEKLSRRKFQFVAPAEFPPVDLDLCFVAPKSRTVEELMRSMQKLKPALLEDIRAYDIFEGASLGEGKKSITFALRYRANDRTLTSDEAKSAHESLVAGVIKAFPAGEIALR